MISNKRQLNKEQKKAVEHVDGPMLVVAGAGTGKTTILIERLRYLLDKKFAKGDEILLLTFTEKGAGEMEDRALEILPYGFFDLWISTFHGFCERVLREHALDIGLSPDFKIISSTEQWILLKKNLASFGLDYYKPLGNPNKFIYELVKHFSRLKDEYISHEEYLSFTEEILADQDISLGGIESNLASDDVARYQELSRAYATYNQLLLDKGYLDFGDLINYTLRLLESRPNILAQYREKFKFIMIDEFQDTNWSQYALIKLLAKPKNNLLVVGDDDQSIYKFRGASLSNILQFKDDYPQAQETVLTNNYRSGQIILDTAYNFIKHNNPHRLEEKIKINKRLNAGLAIIDRVEHHHFITALDEQEWVSQRIKEIQENSQADWSDFAILVRANSAADNFVAELNRQNIPNTFVSLRGLYYKSIILDVIAYLKLLDNYHESSALFRVLNMEVFQIQHRDIVAINRLARRKAWSLFEALHNLSLLKDFDSQTAKRINFLLKLIKKHSQMVQTISPSKIFVDFVHEAGLDSKKYHENREYFSYLNQFYKKMIKFESDVPDVRLVDFMELLTMELEAGDTGALRLDYDDADRVSIMTVHASKGLEFKYVFLVNLVDKKFPSINRKDKIVIPDKLIKEVITESKSAHLEEERRLFYVALTRAKQHLYLTSAKDYGGVREKKPSIFIKEAGLITIEQKVSGVNNNILLRDIKQSLNPLTEIKSDLSLPNKFSFSQIEAYNNCPLQYKFNFILKIPVPSKAVFVFGHLMHNTLKEVMLGLIQNTQLSMFATSKDSLKSVLSWESIIKIYQKYWRNDGYDSAEDREQYKKEGRAMLKLFYNFFTKNGWPQVMFVEKSFTHRFGNYYFRGSIDRIDKLADGGVEIIDYKTGNPKDKLTYQDKKQLILYKIVLEEGLGLKVNKQTFFYLKNAQALSFNSTLKEEDKLKQEIKIVIAKISQAEFIPKPGFLCTYCDFQNICEFKKNS